MVDGGREGGSTVVESYFFDILQGESPLCYQMPLERGERLGLWIGVLGSNRKLLFRLGEWKFCCRDLLGCGCGCDKASGTRSEGDNADGLVIQDLFANPDMCQWIGCGIILELNGYWRR